MKENSNKIILYPSNWLYNAGVVGFLRVVEFGGGKEIKRYIKEILKREPFYFTQEEIKIVKEKFYEYVRHYVQVHEIKTKDIRSFLFNKQSGILPNLQQLTKYGIVSDKDVIKWWDSLINNAIEQINSKSLKMGIKCRFCNTLIRKEKYIVPYDFWDLIYNSLTATTYLKNTNWFFYAQTDLIICEFCKIILILSNFVISKRSPNKEFINVPSFKALYYLNNLLLKLKKQETWKRLQPNEKLESLLSEALLTYEFLKGVWVLQNVELIEIEKGEVYNLPISRTSAELMVRSDTRKCLGNLKGKINIAKQFKPHAQKEGMKRFLTGGEGSLVDLAYYGLRTYIEDYLTLGNPNISKKEKEQRRINKDKMYHSVINLSRLEKIKIDYSKERRFYMKKNEIQKIWNKGADLSKEVKKIKYQILGCGLIEDRKRALEYISDIEKKNKIDLKELKDFITQDNLNVREIITVFVAGAQNKGYIKWEEVKRVHPVEALWNEGKEIGKGEKVEDRVKKYGFRMLQRVRLGDKEGFSFEMLKLYLLKEKQTPFYIAEILKDEIDLETFKLYAYAFIAGYLSTEDKVYDFVKAGENIISETLEDRIKKHGYRILSLIKGGQRGDVIFEILKLYANQGKGVPDLILNLLKPEISRAEFQSLAYSFLVGFLKEKKEA